MRGQVGALPRSSSAVQPNQCGLYANCGSGYLSAAAFEQHDVEGQQFVSTLAEACGVSE